MNSSKILKIVFVIDSLASGGAERVMSVLANEFSSLNFEVVILLKSQEKSFYPLDDRVRLIFPKTRRNFRGIIKTFFSRTSIYLEIYKSLREAKPNIVISFSTTTNGILILLCKFLGLPIIASEHNNYKVKAKSIPYRIIKRCIYPHANVLTVLTNRDKEEYYGKFMRNVIVMPNPLSLKPFDLVDTMNRKKTILAIGNLSRWEHKGIDNLLEIFSSISIMHPDWRLNIAGGGDETYVASMIQNLKLDEKVELLGEIKNIESIMQKCSIFALTSRWEGLPMVLIEAMSQGMACIAYDCFTGPAEILISGLNGVLVQDQNISEFKDELAELIINENLRKKYGNSAINTSKEYLPSKIVPKWQKTITQTILQQ